MADRVLVVLPDGRWLAMSRDAFEAALTEGAKLSAAPAAAPSVAMAGDEPLLNADELAKVLNLPKSWVYEKARTGDFPCVRTGKHVRFSRSAVLAALAATARVASGHA